MNVAGAPASIDTGEPATVAAGVVLPTAERLDTPCGREGDW